MTKGQAAAVAVCRFLQFFRHSKGSHIRCVRHLESTAEVVPEAEVLLVAGFQQCEHGIACVAVAAGSGGYFAPRHLRSNVIIGEVVVQRCQWRLKHFEQFGFVFCKSLPDKFDETEQMWDCKDNARFIVTSLSAETHSAEPCTRISTVKEKMLKTDFVKSSATCLQSAARAICSMPTPCDCI